MKLSNSSCDPNGFVFSGNLAAYWRRVYSSNFSSLPDREVQVNDRACALHSRQRMVGGNMLEHTQANFGQRSRLVRVHACCLELLKEDQISGYLSTRE